MSKPISEEEYKKRLASRMKSWIMGEADPLLGNVEIEPKGKTHVDKEVIRSHKKDRNLVVKDVLDVEHNKQYKGFFRFYKVAAVVCCLALILILMVAVSYLPPVGATDNPGSNEVSAKYIEDGMQDTGAVNIVTGMILDYRAFDTFGESNVLFIATCTVLILLRNDKKKGSDSADAIERRDSFFEPKSDSILQKVTFVLFPIIVVFGIYVILNGHLSPGGGFSGGAIIGAGLILYLNAFGFKKIGKFFTANTHKWVSLCALSFYCLAKSYSFFTGANHLDSIISQGTPGAIISAGLILPLNICVGLVVACTMYSFYVLFRKGGY